MFFFFQFWSRHVPFFEHMLNERITKSFCSRPLTNVLTQRPDWAGLILGQNPPCKELNSSQMPDMPGGRKQINLFSTI